MGGREWRSPNSGQAVASATRMNENGTRNKFIEKRTRERPEIIYLEAEERSEPAKLERFA